MRQPRSCVTQRSYQPPPTATLQARQMAPRNTGEGIGASPSIASAVRLQPCLYPGVNAHKMRSSAVQNGCDLQEGAVFVARGAQFLAGTARLFHSWDEGRQRRVSLCQLSPLRESADCRGDKSVAALGLNWSCAPKFYPSLESIQRPGWTRC